MFYFSLFFYMDYFLFFMFSLSLVFFSTKYNTEHLSENNIQKNIYKDFHNFLFIFLVLSFLLYIYLLLLQKIELHTFCYQNSSVFYLESHFFLKIVLSLLFFLYFFLLWFLQRVKQILTIEYALLLLLSYLSLLNLIVVKNYIVFIGLIELVSLSFFSISQEVSKNVISLEASLKYFILSAISSIFMLLGFALLYSETGLLYFNIFSDYFFSNYIFLGLTFLLITMTFKIGLFPFHVWLLDVYSGINLVVLTFFSVFPKLIYFIVFGNIFLFFYGAIIPFFSNLLLFLIILTVILGVMGVLRAKKLQYFQASSTVVTMGFILLGLVGGSLLTYASSISFYYLYSFFTFLFFATWLLLRTGTPVLFSNLTYQILDQFKNLFRYSPFLGTHFSTLLLCIAGFPPYMGFYLKYNALSNLLVDIPFYFIATLVFLLVLSILNFYGFWRFLGKILFSKSRKLRYPMQLGIGIYVFMLISFFLNHFVIFYLDIFLLSVGAQLKFIFVNNFFNISLFL